MALLTWFLDVLPTCLCWTVLLFTFPFLSIDVKQCQIWWSKFKASKVQCGFLLQTHGNNVHPTTPAISRPQLRPQLHSIIIISCRPTETSRCRRCPHSVPARWSSTVEAKAARATRTRALPRQGPSLRPTRHSHCWAQHSRAESGGRRLTEMMRAQVTVKRSANWC